MHFLSKVLCLLISVFYVVVHGQEPEPPDSQMLRPPAYASISWSQHQLLPERTINYRAQLQPGISEQDGLLHLYGGQAFETGHFLGNLYTSNFSNGQNRIYLIPEALSTTIFSATPFSASFGGATAGQIRSEMSIGGEQLSFAFFHRSDNFAGEGESFLGTNSFGNQVSVAMLSGTLGNPNLRFFVAGEFNPISDSYRRFTTGIDLPRLVDSNHGNPKYSGINAVDFDVVEGASFPDGNTPRSSSDLAAVNANLAWHSKSVDSKLLFTFLNRDQTLNETPILRILNERKLVEHHRNFLLSSENTLRFNDKHSINAAVSFFKSRNEDQDDFFGADWRSWYDSTANAAHGVTYEGRWRPEADYLFNGFHFQRNGNPYTNIYQEQEDRFIDLRGEYKFQANKWTAITAGASYRQHQNRQFLVNANAVAQLTNEFDRIEDLELRFWLAAARPNYIGYDIYGNPTDEGEGPSSPAKLPDQAIYLQTDFRFDRFSLTGGLRYQSIQSANYSFLPALPVSNRTAEISTINQFDDDEWERSEKISKFLPRFQSEFAIRPNWKITAGYGEYLQYGRNIIRPTNIMIPQFTNPLPSIVSMASYQDDAWISRQFAAGTALKKPGLGNLEADLLIRSAAPEAYERSITSSLFMLSGSLARRKGMAMRGNISFTNVKDEFPAKDPRNVLSNNSVPSIDVDHEANYNHPLRIDVVTDYLFSHDNSLLNSLNICTILRYHLGHPYDFLRNTLGQASPYSAGVSYIADLSGYTGARERTPSVIYVDFSLRKIIRLKDRMHLELAIQATNLLNRQNIINVYATTGVADDDGFINSVVAAPFINANGGEDYENLYRQVNLENGEAYRDSNVGPGLDLWGVPRQIFLQLGFYFR